MVTGQRLLLRTKHKPAGLVEIVKREWKKVAVALALIVVAVLIFRGIFSVSVSIEPKGPVTLLPFQTQTFTATVKRGKTSTVIWSLDPAIGSISSEGIYKAPASISTGQTVKVIARSQDDLGRTATATVLLAPMPIQIDPPTTALGPNQSTQFSAEPATFSVEEAEDLGLAVDWSVDPAVGTITPAGVYTAPASIPAAQNVTVTATSKTAPAISAHAKVFLKQSTAIQVTLSPKRTSLGASERRQFTATLNPNSGEAILWSVNPPIGSVSPQGLYAAPTLITAARQVQVMATLASDSNVAGIANVTLQPIAVSPITATVNGKQIVLHATVMHASNTNLLWSINPQIGGISAEGIYTEPTNLPTDTDVTVTAASQADPTRFSRFVIHLKPKITVTFNPHPGAMTNSQQYQFTATVSGTQNTGVTWSITGPGTLLPNGLYTAPATIPPGGAMVQIFVTSNADSGKQDSGSFRLMPNGAPQRLRVSQGVAEGRLVHKVSPVYPESARLAGIQGTVVLQAVIGKDGLVHNVQVQSGPPTLVNSALAAVRQWRYQPYLLDGQAVEVETTINVKFTLQ